MLNSINDTLNKTCLVGLSYFTAQDEPLKQNIVAGRVISVDSEMGITIALATSDTSTSKPGKEASFILPTNLSCWFIAPKGEFHTSQKGVKIINPDYLVTWDIYQTKAPEKDTSAKKPTDGEQQWWQWRPRTQAPNVG
jgi:hypothetical protein